MIRFVAFLVDDTNARVFKSEEALRRAYVNCPNHVLAVHKISVKPGNLFSLLEPRLERYRIPKSRREPL